MNKIVLIGTSKESHDALFMKCERQDFDGVVIMETKNHLSIVENPPMIIHPQYTFELIQTGQEKRRERRKNKHKKSSDFLTIFGFFFIFRNVTDSLSC